MDTDAKREVIVVDRGLARTKKKVHGVNPALLFEKILREKIQDAQYWFLKASRLEFYDILKECVDNVVVIGTYLNASKSKICMFIALLFRLIQLDITISDDIVEWIIIGDHGYKYLTVLFMIYARLMWEDNVKLWTLLESKLKDYRKIRILENGVVRITYIDEISDDLLINNKFIDMTLPRIVNRWVLEDSGALEERESELMDEFEEEINALNSE
jgi:pre-mRNA-splicing factor 38A